MFEHICDSVFWNTSSSWNTSSPNPSQCLQSTVLIWLPCLILWLCLPFEVWQASQSKKRKLGWSFHSGSKLFFNLLLVILSAVKLTCDIQRYDLAVSGSDIATILGSSLMCATHVFILVATLHREQRGIRVSYVLSFFWLFWALSTWLMAYSSIHNADYWWDEVPHGRVEYVVTIAIPVIVSVQLIVSAFVEPIKPQQFIRLDTQDDEDNCQLTSNSLFNYIFFMWMNRCMFRGMKGLLEPKDLPPLCSDHMSRSITEKYEEVESNSKRKYSRLQLGSGQYSVSLVYLLWCSCWKSFILATVLELLNILIDYLPPFMLQKLIVFVTSDEPDWHGYLYGILFCLGTTISSLAFNLSDYIYSLCSLKCRISLTAAIYKKILKLSPGSRQEFPSGKILNLMSTDVVQIYSLLQNISTLWGAPVRIILTQLYLWQYLGASSLASLVVMFIMICLSFCQGRVVEKLQVKIMLSRDQRLKQMNEILNGIKILKLYAWEKPFLKRVLQTRKEELSCLRKSYFLNSFFIFLWTAAPFLVCASCFVSYTLSGHNLDPATTFVSFSLINILRFPMGMISHVIVMLIITMVSTKRMKKFLNCQEYDSDAVGMNTAEGEAITICDATLSWTKEIENFTLKNINLKVPKGSLVAVVGAVGSGKSSIFAGLIGDMYKLDGAINLQGSVAYVPQQAWIQNATLQRNVLFMKPYLEHKYNKLIDACALRPDLGLLSGGDQTEIGEKGINLSGGQKQRVSLARAAYQDADIYLLDDPLSAVDANVSAHIFKELIGPNGFLKKKTRIFATHNISFLPEVDHIIVLSEGIIVEEGSYSLLMEQKGPLADLVQNHAGGVFKKTDKEEIPAETSMNRQDSVLSQISGDTEVQEFSPLMSEEGMEKGRVTWSVYKNYAIQTGLLFFFMIISFGALCSTADVGSGVWLSRWTDRKVVFSSQMTGLGIYCGLVATQALLIFLTYIILFVGTTRASANLHEGLLNCIIRAPLSFFDTTPTGRVVNRFSSDMETVDTNLPWVWGNFLTWSCWVPATLIVILVSSPYLLILFVPLLGLYLVVLRAYVITSNQLQRFTSVSNSPVMSCFTETIQGYGSIRAFNVQAQFTEDCFNKLDQNNKCSFYSNLSGKWLDSVLTIISNIIVLFVAFLAVWEKNDLQAGMLGLILTYVIQVSGGLNWLVKGGAELESSIVSVERIQEYSQLAPEDLWEKPDSKPSDNWPSLGEITFSNFSTCYREGLDPVLKNVNVRITSGAKVGVAGRTGAGKSSFILSLFRIIEPTQGEIVIDGIDITKIGVHDLRSKLTVIPQDPVLFGVSLRKNLDPLDEYSDDQIWKALEHSHLKPFVESLAEGLGHQITEGGNNISAGQRQLLCLARALLRKTKILVLDEATASVDLDTDQLIQKTVEETFADCTVIIIAHRLQTILKCNQILVFSEGQLIENDSPDNLLQNPTSQFYSMAKDSGLV